MIGLFLTLIPAYVAALANSANLLLGGGVVTLVLAGSASPLVLLLGATASWPPRSASPWR